MGRGRGKGKKLTAVTTHDDVGNEGEEALPTYRRRGGLQKPLMDDIDEDDNTKNEEFTEEVKHSVAANELKHSMVQKEKKKKRKRYSQVKESNDSVSEKNDNELNKNSEETTKSNGFRHNGSRRKSKPHRAAEA